MVIIDGFRIDLAKAETLTLGSLISDYPVEKGSDKTDNIRPKQLGLLVESVHSDSPLTTSLIPGSIPSDECLAKLRSVHAGRKPVIVQTSFGTFEEMALENLVIPRDVATGRALRFTATFRQIEVAANEKTTVSVATPTAKGKTNRGHDDPVTIPYTVDGKPAVQVKLDPKTYFAKETPMAKKMRAGRIPTAVGGGDTSKGAGNTLGDWMRAKGYKF